MPETLLRQCMGALSPAVRAHAMADGGVAFIFNSRLVADHALHWIAALPDVMAS